jgi:adenine-specific DNA-methyltransferase
MSIAESTATEPVDVLERVDFLRVDAGRKLDATRKVKLGQFMTPAPVAQLMASMLECSGPDVHILDPGAGIGSLFAAAVAHLCRRSSRPQCITVTAYELDPLLIEYLADTLELCKAACKRASIQFTGEVIQADFIESAVDILDGGLFAAIPSAGFNCVIMNPPYRKINTDSETRRLLRRIGIETSNLYTGFLAAAVQLLQPGGELVAITPRSFCNGPYFRPFREFFLRTMSLRRVHVFESRQDAFSEDEVLQENLIFHAVKESTPPKTVMVTASEGLGDDLVSLREVDYPQMVQPADPQSFIHIVPDDLGQRIRDWMERFHTSLDDLGITVSTGRVVDFRARCFLRPLPEQGAAPLIYPTHFDHGYVAWPKPDSRKANALLVTEHSQGLLVPNEHYVLVKRFSSKEERKRVVAAVYDADRVPGTGVGFENHLNYFHRDGRGLDLVTAKGLAAFLNWTIVDAYFRQFNGHTQVNATDLRSMRYPSLAELSALGKSISDLFPDQNELDALIERELACMADSGGINPVETQKRIQEALTVLRHLGLPRGQQNERSALTLLALLDLKPPDPWSSATSPLIGITPIMEFAAVHYGKNYAPNTRETVRRQTVHQFRDAGLIVANPDSLTRAINSPKTVYQIEGGALELLRSYGDPSWEHNLRAYLASVETLQKRYAAERQMQRIPVQIAPGKTITLSPGGQNILVEQIIKEFAERFTPGGKLLYVGDTGDKFAYFDRDALAELGVVVDTHGKMPDVIVHYTERDWLVLIEAVTSHGPVDPKRRDELKALFTNSRAGLVYVTAFLNRKAMVEYLDAISWETEVWVAEAPSHLIHFNGERFLGPY